jgi:hypothetical protein
LGDERRSLRYASDLVLRGAGWRMGTLLVAVVGVAVGGASFAERTSAVSGPCSWRRRSVRRLPGAPLTRATNHSIREGLLEGGAALFGSTRSTVTAELLRHPRLAMCRDASC